MRWDKPKNPLPSFALPDLEGKTWKLADLSGKVVMINIWATWCGPCRAEHPEFQKLVNQWKDRKDVVLLSLNVDDAVGLVAPYMKQNGYTFPVLVAKDLVETVAADLIIPQNWFVSRSGKLEAVQVGFGASAEWTKTVTSKVEELLKAN